MEKDKDIITLIDEYFNTYMLLFYAIFHFVAKHKSPEMVDCDKDFFNDNRIFLINIETLKKQLIINMLKNVNSVVILKRYITQQYNVFKNELIHYLTYKNEILDLDFPLKISYSENCTPRKMMFFADISFIKPDDSVSATLRNICNKTIQELENDYNEIMQLFTDTPTPETKENKQPQQKTLSLQDLINKGIPAELFTELETEKYLTCKPLHWLKGSNTLSYFGKFLVGKTLNKKDKIQWADFKCFICINNGKTIQVNDNLKSIYKAPKKASTNEKNGINKLEIILKKHITK